MSHFLITQKNDDVFYRIFFLIVFKIDLNIGIRIINCTFLRVFSTNQKSNLQILKKMFSIPLKYIQFC